VKEGARRAVLTERVIASLPGPRRMWIPVWAATAVG
jgi:hypothetical protein